MIFLRYTDPMKYFGRFLLLAAIVSGAVVPAAAILAQENDPVSQPFTAGLLETMNFATSSGISGETNVFSVLSYVIKWLLALSAMLAMGAIVWGGITYILSLGDESKAEHAKTIIKYAVVGVVVILLSYVIIAFIQTLLIPPKPGAPAPGAFLPVSTAYAQDVTNGFNTGLGEITGKIAKPGSGLATDTNIVPVITRLINYMLGLVGVLALAALVWGAIMYILSIGDEGKVEKAKNIIIYAIIGVLLTGFAFVILRVLQFLITGKAA